jgi:poly-gamma-glutamate synthesis protein (capsule biosynthesis protein)
MIFEKKWKRYYFQEHGIGNHFLFLNKYFSKSKIYSVIVNPVSRDKESQKKLSDFLLEYNFSWDTLFVASVDFSHHVNEKIAIFHDKKTVDFLNDTSDEKVEVDCPNCLMIVKDMAYKKWNTSFEITNRTSVDTQTWLNSNYDNTSHIYGYFSQKSEWNTFPENPNILQSTFENFPQKDNKNFVYGMFFGDAHFARRMSDPLNPRKPEEYFACLYHNKDTKKDPSLWHNRMLYGYDYVWVNLETSVAQADECQTSSKSIRFRTPPQYLDDMKKVWINLFTFANNHSLDCWKTWYQATKAYLQEKNLLWYGDMMWEKNVLLEEKNGTKIAFVGYNDVDTKINPEQKAQDIKKLTQQWNIVIINIHWWEEYAKKSNQRQQRIARLFIDNWAKLIVWHHPHVVQEYETYKWVPIIYSLWNFIFDQPFPETLEWYALSYAINGEEVQYNILSFYRSGKNYLIDCNSFQ